MDAHDKPTAPDADLLAAAQVAVRWGHAQRATWTDEPLQPAPQTEAEGQSTLRTDVDEERPSALAALAEGARAFAPSIGRWAGFAAVGALVAGAGAVGARYIWRTTSARRPTSARLEPVGATARGNAASTRGELRVSSTPSGARVRLDGKERGVTPLTVGDVTIGTHDLVLTSSAGTVHRTVKVADGTPTEIDEAIFPGWVAVLAPFEVAATEGGRALRIDERNQIMLAPGAHDLQLANRSLSFATVQHVDVTPGAVTTVRITPPTSTLTVTAGEPSEVWLDGSRIGVTPVNAVAAPLGAHEIVVKRPSGDRRFSVTIGTGPFTLNADAAR